MRRIVQYFPLSHGVGPVDDRRIVSAISRPPFALPGSRRNRSS